jgi:hypothetical protein
MKFKVIALIVCSALVTVASGASGAGRARVEANTSTLSVSDVADVLGVRWWGFNLEFDEPISMVTVRPCELRRRADGGWDRVHLSVGRGYGRAVGDRTGGGW